MFYNLFYKLFGNEFAILNTLKYVTFRSICAFLTSFLIVFIFAKSVIALFRKYQSGGQPIRDDGPQSHLVSKQGTPTMGGILIIISIISSCLLWGNLSNIYLWLCIVVLFGFGAIGAIDDYQKVTKRDYHGINAKTKFLYHK